MAGRGEDRVRAEVLLREGGAAEKVAAFLRQHGIEVTSIGAASLSIRCDPSTFERVFGVRLQDAAQGAAPEGVQDFGPVGPAGAQAEGAPRIPQAIAEDVEGVYLQQPPRLH